MGSHIKNNLKLISEISKLYATYARYCTYIQYVFKKSELLFKKIQAKFIIRTESLLFQPVCPGYLQPYTHAYKHRCKPIHTCKLYASYEIKSHGHNI